jgi:hypothetical protein
MGKRMVSMLAAISLLGLSCRGASGGNRHVTTMEARKDLVWQAMTQFKWERAKPSGLFVMSGRVPQWLGRGDGSRGLRPALFRVHPDKRRIHIDGLILVDTGKQVSITIIQACSFNDAKEIVATAFVVNSAAADWPVTWQAKTLGDISAGHHKYGKKEEAWTHAYFVRGNVVVMVTASYEEDEYLDPRPVAASIDAYLLAVPKREAPTKKLPVQISLALDGAVTVRTPDGREMQAVTEGTDCRLTIAPPPPRDPVHVQPPSQKRVGVGEIMKPDRDPAAKLPPAGPEMQIRVSGGSVTRTAEGTYIVRFYAAGEQTVECWYLDAEGTVTAYGNTTVTVRAREASKSP